MPQDGQTIRVSNLPSHTRPLDVTRWFESRIRRKSQRPVICKVGPLCPYAGGLQRRTTVTFWNKALAREALAWPRQHSTDFLPAEGPPSRNIILEDRFSDLTTLYSSPKSRTGEPTADFVVVHGLNGHPWTSFVSPTSVENGTEEYMWLRDTLPEYLEERSIYPRIMTYGWNANVWVDPADQTTSEAAMSLVQHIDSERPLDSNRPLFFIGHSLGGIVIKQAVNELVNRGLARDENGSFESPVKGCFFFATPHRGSGLADPYAKILSTIRAVLVLGGGPNDMLVRELRLKGEEFARISMEFDSLRQVHEIKTISCYEQKRIHNSIVVPRESAILDWDPSRNALPINAFPVDADHRDIVKFSSAVHPGFPAIMAAIISIVKAALQPTGQSVTDLTENMSSAQLSPPLEQQEATAHGEENILANLNRFKTVFLVDDSGSMRGPRWRMAERALAEITLRAFPHNRSGVDVRFLNSEEEGIGLGTAREVADLFHRVRPDGTTPTEDALDAELNAYLVDYKQNRLNRKFKKLNLIVLTDGEPDPENDVEACLVRYAKELQNLGANRHQIGVQFVQIGDDRKATEFLKHLDDGLKDKHNLDRDMVDTVPWSANGNDKLYLKILLGGILSRFDEDDDIGAG
ncbi:MAG: hypothetical protein M1836_000785 [Candelina mexicana]|nr:MAG: hypothetical protein M1836_000785 [Candelina mexicana]